MAHDAFISYSSVDKAIADAACATLENAGIRCWIAPRDITPGLEYGAAIVRAIDHCRVLILIFSSSANSSRQIPREVERAINKGVPVVPMRVEDVAPTESLAYFMESVHWLDALTPPLEGHLQRLAESVQALLAVGAGEAAPREPHAGPARPSVVAAVAAAAMPEPVAKPFTPSLGLKLALLTSIAINPLLAGAERLLRRLPRFRRRAGNDRSQHLAHLPQPRTRSRHGKIRRPRLRRGHQLLHPGKRADQSAGELVPGRHRSRQRGLPDAGVCPIAATAGQALTWLLETSRNPINGLWPGVDWRMQGDRGAGATRLSRRP
jgi:hypothetical protein